MILFMITFFLTSCGVTHDENQLRKQFNENINTLIKLEEMLREDRVFSDIQLSRYEQFPKENGIIKRNVSMTEKRWDDYRHLFYKAGLEFGVQYYGPEQERSVRFNVYEGMGYQYSEVPIVKTENISIHNSFKECRLAKLTHGICYVMIQKNWYLYFFNN